MDASQKPSVVSEKFVRQIKDGCDTEGFYLLKKFIVGQTVRVEHGVLTGMSGIYDGQLPHERVAVLFEMLGTTVRASVREDDIVAA